MKLVLLVSVVVMVSFVPATAQPNMGFDDYQIVIKGITPGGRVACYGLGHDFVAIRPEILRWAQERVDDDLDGGVVIEVTRRISRLSIWACADVASGGVFFGSPTYEESREHPFSGLGWKPGDPSGVFGADGAQRDFFLVRPAEGAWLAIAGDGGSTDADSATDGSVFVSPQAFQGLGAVVGMAAPLEPTATMVILEPHTLEYSIVQLSAR
jgi:hypothetical protein